MTKSKQKLSLLPIYVLKNGGCDEAWFYENARSIDVYIYKAGTNTYRCRIPLKHLEDYVKRAKSLAALQRKDRPK